MDYNDDSQQTQPATQNVVDPRRFGQQNSGFSDAEIADIICILYPNSETARREVQNLASLPEYNRFITGRNTADRVDTDLDLEDSASQFGRTRGLGDHAIVLRLSDALKDVHSGHTFGRNARRCDLCFVNDPGKRVSNIHFSIYINEHRSIMVRDSSTNGTVVDNKLLRANKNPTGDKSEPKEWTLQSGSTVGIVMHNRAWDLTFLVRIPRRDEILEQAYLDKLDVYLQRAGILEDPDDDVNRTIGPGPNGHVDLFHTRNKKGTVHQDLLGTTLGNSRQRLPREWRGGEKYARVGKIGQGAFATVYKVTSKYDGAPYAAKELDKRKFIKNGILDQKVENEMKIMQKVQHANIVQYIEHFDWDVHQFIIIMEFVPGGDLGKLINDYGPLDEPYARVIASQLIDALGYLHDKRITHRDVKPDNILIQSTSPLVVKLTDFGLSKMIDTEQTFLKTFCGTLLYCAPEVYNEYASYNDHGYRTSRKNQRALDKERYDHAVDIWSLGGVLFFTIVGKPPFPVKNNITYTALLDHIMKVPLDTAPLEQRNLSPNGIHFLTRMINVRPEMRATISELQAHPWLGGLTSSTEGGADEQLEQGASQLSLDERQASQLMVPNSNSYQEPEPDFSMDYESEKENNTFGRPQPNRLFGEVSAIGSSGVIPEGRLNLPVSNSALDDTETEILDSFGESEDSETPRQKASAAPGILSAGATASTDNSRSALLGIGSQSLGGASSILENLNMTSLANAGPKPITSKISDLTSSKRKPGYETSDDFESNASSTKPNFKRLKSLGDADQDREEEEYVLLASVPPLNKNKTGRQINYPLPKTFFWDTCDKDTWHLRYPEMTHLQYSAFESAADKRHEEFGPGKTPLWTLAMENFPPFIRQTQPEETSRTLDLRPTLLKRDNGILRESIDWNMPSTELAPGADADLESIPDTLPPGSQFPPALQQPMRPAKTVVGMFHWAPGSLVSGNSIPLKDPVMSWGRERGNTVMFHQIFESKVPKNAFRLVLWRAGYNATFEEFRPWEPGRSVASRTLRESPNPESFAFYISTKATNGIRINKNPLPTNEPKDSEAACKHWMKLHHGDAIVLWGGDEANNQAKLVFECSWGGSSVPRPADEPPTCVPEWQAKKLDQLWPKAVKTLYYDRVTVEAQIDQEMRMGDMEREQERSRVFEIKRAEAVRLLQLRASRQTSPASAPPTGGRIRARWFTPPEPSFSGSD